MRKPKFLLLVLFWISAFFYTAIAGNLEQENSALERILSKRMDPGLLADEPDVGRLQGDSNLDSNSNNANRELVNQNNALRQQIKDETQKSAALAIQKENMEQKLQIADMKNSVVAKKITNKKIKNQKGLLKRTKRPKRPKQVFIAPKRHFLIANVIF